MNVSCEFDGVKRKRTDVLFQGTCPFIFRGIDEQIWEKL